MTTPRQRDHGLNRVSSLTRWTIVGATAATGVFGFLLARPAPTAAKVTAATPTVDEQTGTAPREAPGSTSTTVAGGSSATTRSTRPSAPLKAPTTVPQRASRRSQATSGGS